MWMLGREGGTGLFHRAGLSVGNRGEGHCLLPRLVLPVEGGWEFPGLEPHDCLLVTSQASWGLAVHRLLVLTL